MRPLIYTLLITFLLNPQVSLGQINTSPVVLNTTQNSPIITLSPATPAPNTEFNASLGLVEFGSEIIWRLNNQELVEFTNQNNIDLQTGTIGETLTLSAEIITPTGQRMMVTKDISPLYVDIILEPQTYAPDFFLGRSLPSFGSQVNATAIISNGEGMIDTDLVYRWQVGSEVVGQGSVRGQHKVSFLVPKGSFPTLSLSVSKPSGELVASRFITMPSVYPDLLFYEKSTLFGLSHKPVDRVLTLVSDSTLVEAAPYHLDSRVYNSPDLAEWEIGQSTFDSLSGNPYEVTLQRNSGGGAVRLNFHVRSMDNLLQGAEDSINIIP